MTKPIASRRVNLALAVYGPMDVLTLARRLRCNVNDIKPALNALGEHGTVVMTSNGYSLTDEALRVYRRVALSAALRHASD